MPELEFTQFLLPNGRRREVTTEVSQEAWDKAQDIKEAGFNFEIEVLNTGQVSATISSVEAGVDLAHSITPNGPEVQEGIEKMITDFDILQNVSRVNAIMAGMAE